jgi:hypothetical protein
MLECDDLFNLANIPADQRAKWGIAHVRGQAKTWLNSSTVNLATVTWDRLCEILIERFPDTVSTDPMDQMQQLQQVNSVNNYIDTFENWMTSMKRGRPYLPADFFVDRFISGLKESIKHNVICQKPSTLMSAYWYAREYEKSFLSSVKRTTVSGQFQRPNTTPQTGRPFQARDNAARPANDRPRLPRKCWYCPEVYVRGHSCTGMQRVLNAISMQYESDDDIDDVNTMIAAVETK